MHKMMKYELIIFDMDGTILDTLEDLHDALNYSLSLFGYEKRSVDDVRRFLGNGIKKLVERAVPENTPAHDIDNIIQAFLTYYQQHCMDKTKPYAGVTRLIKTLKDRGYLTAVVSNKADPAVQELCRIYFDGLFDYAVGEKNGIKKKPAPDSVISAMEKLGTKNAIYIGDSEVDIETAKNSGIDCILCTWGFRDKDFLIEHGALLFADKAEDILDFV